MLSSLSTHVDCYQESVKADGLGVENGRLTAFEVVSLTRPFEILFHQACLSIPISLLQQGIQLIHRKGEYQQ